MQSLDEAEHGKENAGVSSLGYATTLLHQGDETCLR
jgi:hypothetical protein